MRSAQTRPSRRPHNLPPQNEYFVSVVSFVCPPKLPKPFTTRASLICPRANASAKTASKTPENAACAHSLPTHRASKTPPLRMRRVVRMLRSNVPIPTSSRLISCLLLTPNRWLNGQTLSCTPDVAVAAPVAESRDALLCKCRVRCRGRRALLRPTASILGLGVEAIAQS